MVGGHLFLVCLASAAALPEPEAGLGIEHLPLLSREKRGGACSTSDECVAPNVCSKWGWCQWTKIYGEEGPSQGAAAPAGGVAGQCVTSADCASRVPYCSKLGFCHGGRLPFDPEQLEIPEEDFAAEFPSKPQGLVNNNPWKNNPIISEAGGGARPQGAAPGQRRSQARAAKRSRLSKKQRNRSKGKTNNIPKRRKPSRGKSRGRSQRKPAKSGRRCSGGLDACVDNCLKIKALDKYVDCIKGCGKNC